jgi:hypothetical protein
MEEGIDRQGMHTFWRNYVSKLKKKKPPPPADGIHASGACGKSSLKINKMYLYVCTKLNSYGITACAPRQVHIDFDMSQKIYMIEKLYDTGCSSLENETF